MVFAFISLSQVQVGVELLYPWEVYESGPQHGGLRSRLIPSSINFFVWSQKKKITEIEAEAEQRDDGERNESVACLN